MQLTTPSIRADQYEKLKQEARQLGISVENHIQNVVQKMLEEAGEITARSAKTGPSFRTK